VSAHRQGLKFKLTHYRETPDKVGKGSAVAKAMLISEELWHG